jgi:hypothetical protein
MGKTKQKKRNTKKFRKNINKQNGKSKKTIVVGMVDLGDKVPLLNKNIYNYYGEKEDFTEGTKDVLYIPSYKTLPEEIVNKIEKHITKNPIRRGRCHPTSSLLTLNIEGINTCRGWFNDNVYEILETFIRVGETESVQYQQEVIKEMEYQREKGNRFIWIQPNKFSETCWLDTKTGNYYLTHSWNEYNGVHFDLTGEFHKSFLRSRGRVKKWKHYKLKTIETKEDLLKNTEFGKSQVSLNQLNSYYTGSGKYELVMNDDVFPILNENYKMRYMNGIIMN